MQKTVSRFKCAGLSDTGQKRENNEDRFHIDPDRGIFLVVDGVGGHAAGEQAAETAVGLLQARLERQTGSVPDRIREAITVANNEIYRLAQSNSEWEGMACVLTVVVIEDGQATIGHVGDSRLYKIQQGEIRKVTHDHSPVGEREDQGDMTEIEAMRHPRRNQVYRDVGSEPHTPDDTDFIELVEIPFEPDTALLLCSDGLSDLLTSSQILQIVREHGDDEWAIVRALVNAANEAGGKDNVTVVFVAGERFPAAAQVAPVVTPTRQLTGSLIRSLASRWAVFLYGVLLGTALLYILQTRFGFDPTGADVSSPKTLSVGPGQSFDFATIAQALAKAQPGDTVEVAPGQYAEQIQLRDGVTITSQKPRETLLRPVTAGLAVLATNLKAGRLIGFRIIGGVRLVDADVEIADTDISGSREPGIEIRGAARPVLRADFIHDNAGPGISIRDQAAPQIINNILIRNGRQAIEILEQARPILMDNSVR